MFSDERSQSVEGASPFFDADLPPGELERILDRIRHNLAFEPISGDAMDETQQPPTPVLPFPPLPGLPEIGLRLEYMRFLRDSFRAPPPARPVGIVAFLLNLPFRLFGRKQMRLNNEVVQLLSDELRALQAIETLLQDIAINQNEYAESIAGLQKELHRLGQEMVNASGERENHTK